MTLAFHFEEFDGPMDLLIHLLEKNKIDVYDIPIAVLTDQYLAYLDQAQSMNLELASSFVLFAAKLIRIKSKMLLPGRPKPDEEEEEDPRQALVDRILLYQAYKEAARALEARAEAEKGAFFRLQGPPLPQAVTEAIPVQEGFNPARLYQGFLDVFERAEEPDPLDVRREIWTMSEMIDQVLGAVAESQGRTTFADLAQAAESREEVLALFLALLECVRREDIQLVQTDPFSSIHILEAS